MQDGEAGTDGIAREVLRSGECHVFHSVMVGHVCRVIQVQAGIWQVMRGSLGFHGCCDTVIGWTQTKVWNVCNIRTISPCNAQVLLKQGLPYRRARLQRSRSCFSHKLQPENAVRTGRYSLNAFRPAVCLSETTQDDTGLMCVLDTLQRHGEKLAFAEKHVSSIGDIATWLFLISASLSHNFC